MIWNHVKSRFVLFAIHHSLNISNLQYTWLRQFAGIRSPNPRIGSRETPQETQETPC